jgi:hypothetical protein
MNNSLDKLIGNDELLTYICLILGIFNTFLMSMVITSIKHNFNIYIFLLFEALFLIFIVYFILKKKDSYNKDDDIKYDWYFYLRVSIITLVFFNFSIYIYNITKDSSKNPRKNGGGPVLSSGRSRSNKVAPAAPAAPTDIDIQIELLNNELKPLTSKYTKGLEMLKSRMQQYPNNITKNSQLVDVIAPLRKRMDEINVILNKLQGESTGASTRASTRASRATAREASRASREASRASRATPTNKVFPYQVQTNIKPISRSDIMGMKELTQEERIGLLSQL